MIEKGKIMRRNSIFKIGAFSAFIMLTGILSPAQENKDKASISPAQRRAMVRDSLRRERLQNREANKVTAPVNSSLSNNPTAIPNTPDVNSPATIPTPSSPEPSSPKMETSSTANSLPNTAMSPVIPLKVAEEVDLPIPDSIKVEALNVRNTEIRDVLQGLGVQYGINILMAANVAGPISVNLHKIKLKEAVRLIAEENGYVLSVVHGAIKVDKKTTPPPALPPPPNFIVDFANNQLSADIQKIPLDQVVRKLVEKTNKTIVADAGLRSDINAFFKNMDLNKGLKLIAESNGLLMREKEGIITFFPQAWNSDGAKPGEAATRRMPVFVKDNQVSMEVTNAPLHDIVSAICQQSGISTVIYGELKGNVTMKISDVPLEQAFQILFRGTEFTFWTHNKVYFIGPQSMQVLDNSKLLVLKHLKAEDVMELLPATLTQKAQLKLVKSQNAIMALGPYEVIDGITQYISQIDLPVAQILIEALVVDVDMDRIRSYGADLFLGDIKRVKSAETIYPAIDQVFNKERSEDLLKGIPGLRDIVSLPKNFIAKVEALETEKVLKIRSRPQIATLNGSEATITVGQTQYFLLKSETDFNQTANVTTKTSQHFEKIEANVTLTVTPFVTGQKEITCDIVPDFSEPEGSFDPNVPPTLNHRILKSKVRLRDGETIVLGGLVKESLNRTNRQVPFFGSIPFIGWLFKNNTQTRSRSQLLIFVTPHIYFGNDANVNPEEYLKKNSDLEK